MSGKIVRVGTFRRAVLVGALSLPLVTMAQEQVPAVASPEPSDAIAPPPAPAPAVLPSLQSGSVALDGTVGACHECGTGVASPPMLSIRQLVGMSALELDQLYEAAPAGGIPVGKTRGRAILYPGTRWASPASKVARVAWQGKVFGGDGTSAVNRFFGVRAIRANVYYGESWLYGKPSIILDYHETSRLYAPYRDEVREVAPGLYLGRMYSRTVPQPTLKLYFALETVH